MIRFGIVLVFTQLFVGLEMLCPQNGEGMFLVRPPVCACGAKLLSTATVHGFHQDLPVFESDK